LRSPDGGLGQGPDEIRLGALVRGVLCEVVKTAKRALSEAKQRADFGVVAPGERKANDPSSTLLDLHFTASGRRLRYGIAGGAIYEANVLRPVGGYAEASRPAL